MSAEADRRTEAIPEWKREEVDDLVAFLERYESVGVVDVAGIPSRQLQDMRAELYGTAELRISRNTLMVRALETVDDGLEDLTEHVTGQVGLIGTDDNPFVLFKQLEASKTPAPINAGEVSPDDVVVPEGDTGIDPGPFVGDLQSVGANARIEGGSIQVVEDSTVLEAGEEVSADLANVLSELGIEPKEVGLDLRSVYSDGVLFESDELAIDVEEYRDDVAAAAGGGRNLSMETGFPTARTLPSMLARATGEAKALGVSASVESPDLADDLIGTADAQVRSLAAVIDDEEALPEELRGEAAAGGAGAADAASAGAADAGATGEGADGDEESDDEPQADAADAEDDDTDDTDGGGGDALGDMFG